MKAIRSLGRILLPAGLVFLAACQTVPGTKTTEPAAPAEETVTQAAEQGAPVAVFLADTVNQPGWTPVQIQSSTLYVNPQPVLTRDDLAAVEAGVTQEGEGLLALNLNNVGQKKVSDITAQNPNKRLALVVGRTMLAAPNYTTPVTTDRLIFAVGTEQNARAAAAAIAGVDESGNPIAPPADAQGGASGTAAPAGN